MDKLKDIWRGLRDKAAVAKAWAWKAAANSRTIAVVYVAEFLAMLDEFRILDWSSLIGSERAGRVMAVMGILMLALRLVTRNALGDPEEESEAA